jgi:hypothetical protein
MYVSTVLRGREGLIHEMSTSRIVHVIYGCLVTGIESPLLDELPDLPPTFSAVNRN